MILAIDVFYYPDNTALGSGVLFKNWDDKIAYKIIHKKIEQVEEYISGQFYKRELPCILALLSSLSDLPDLIIIDGYVYLEDKLGLGGHLYEALNQQIPIIGVAKNPFKNNSKSLYLFRGESSKPLYVTSAGVELEMAKEFIKSMDGNYRIPTFLKLVDSESRKIL